MSGPAVVARRFVATDEGGSTLPESWGFADLYAAAVQLGVREVYVVEWDGVAPGAQLEASHGPVEVEVTGDQGGAWRWRITTPASYLCGPGAPGRVGGQVVTVVGVSEDVSRVAGPWDALDPRELVDAFATVRRLLSVEWASSVGRTAERLILASHPRAKGGTLLDRDPYTPAPCEGSALEMPWTSWRRELTTVERGAQWLHAFDANAQYLGAWGAVEVGHGVPAHVTAPRFDQRVAGVWHVPGLVDVVPPFGEVLPRPWTANRDWFTTPTIARALEVCHGLDFPDVVEAWVWPVKSRFLRGAAETLRDARELAMVEMDRSRRILWGSVADEDAAAAARRLVLAGVALDAVKSVYRVQTGRFGMAARDASSPWARPDWGHFVRAMARVNLHRRLAQLGQAPLAIATDGLIFATDEPDPVKFAAHIRLRLGIKLGEFHHTGSAAAGDVDDLAALDDARPVQLLAAIGEAP